MLEANYDEAAVAAYTLPDPLARSADAWWRQRRPEILALFERHVFGSMPGRPPGLTIAPVEDAPALDGAAIRRQVQVTVGPTAPPLDLLVYLPAHRARPVPAMLGPNFLGNHTVHADPGIRLSRRASEAARGEQAGRWPIEQILARGYAVATFHADDLFPDRPDGAAHGVQPLFPGFGWGALATWAWSMSRALDALETMAEIDAGRVVAIGHSRQGKAALWAAATDGRFAGVVANNSGKGGASLMRRRFGETIRDLVTRFPHWFAAAYRDYADHEDRLPVDQHLLLALAAPRPLYIASASDDLWADPRGEFLSALAADPVYRLLGADGLGASDMPPIEQPIGGRIGYHIRRGEHGVTAWDWERFLDFADRHLGDAGQ